MKSRERVFAYAPRGQIEDWLRLGWLPHDSLEGTRHAQYAILVE